jgi:hypothetical protein
MAGPEQVPQPPAVAVEQIVDPPEPAVQQADIDNQQNLEVIMVSSRSHV